MHKSPENVTWPDYLRNKLGTKDGSGKHEAPSPEEIRGEIERTRAEMSQTIDAIQARLTASSLASQAKDSLAAAALERRTEAQDLVSDARLWVSDLAFGVGEEAKYQVRQMQAWYDRSWQRHIWFPGAFIIGTGAAVGKRALAGWRRVSGRRS